MLLPLPGSLTIKVPQLAVLPLQLPLVADTDMLYVPSTGVLQFGAPIQVISLIVVPSQATVGRFIAVPAVPVAGTLVQVSMYVRLELLLGIELDEDTTAELELLATDELLGGSLELLLGIELDEDTTTELEL